MNQKLLQKYLKRMVTTMVVFLVISTLSFTVSFLAYNNSQGASPTNIKAMTKKINQLDEDLAVINQKSTNIDSRLSVVEEEQKDLDVIIPKDKDVEEKAKEPTDKSNEESKEENNEEKTESITYQTTASHLNFRAKASTDSGVIKVLTKGEKLTPTGKTSSAGGYNWIQAKDTSNKVGWVAKKFLK